MHYLVYFNSDNADEHKAELNRVFGDGNVYATKGASIWVIKTNLPLANVMEKLGFNEAKKNSGFVSRIEPDGINGWFSNTLWDFVRLPANSL